MSNQLLPPRLKDWIPGQMQMGGFLRTRKGAVAEFTRRKACDADFVLFWALLLGAERLPDHVIAAVRASCEAGKAVFKETP